jgi:hypothetical protein
MMVVVKDVSKLVLKMNLKEQFKEVQVEMNFIFVFNAQKKTRSS